MNIQNQLLNNLRTAYEEDEGAKALLDWAAQRTNDAAATSVERIATVTELPYPDARELAKKLCDFGCGAFVLGRKGRKSRILWDFSLRALGKAASGETKVIEEIDPLLREEGLEQLDTGSSSGFASPKPFTIAEAKRRLAEAFGVSPEAIEITIKG